jgi:hypothetical protein
LEASISCPVDKFTYVFCEHLSLESGNEDNIYVSSGKEIKCFDVRLVSILWATKRFEFSTVYFVLRETLLSITSAHLRSLLLHYLFSYQGYMYVYILHCLHRSLIIILILRILYSVLKATTKWEPLENYNYNKEEINKVDTRYKDLYSNIMICICLILLNVPTVSGHIKMNRGSIMCFVICVC